MGTQKAPDLTDEQIAIAKSLRVTGGRPRPWRKIAKAIGVSEMALLRRFAPMSAEAKKTRRRVSYHSKFTQQRMIGLGIRLDARTVDIPQAVKDELDRIQSAPQSVTAMLMGDPPIGRSALDRKRQLTGETA